MNLRHTVPAQGSGARPSNAYWDKCVDLGKWREMRGKMMFKIPPGGWNWQQNPAFCPEMHALLMAAEQCTQMVRSIKLDAPSVSAAVASGGRRALILAVEKYTSPALQGLVNVDNDANLLKRTLQKLGWGVEVVQNAGLDDAAEAIGRFAESVAGSGDACLFAFIGHGAEVSGSVFLVPSDAKLRGEYRETSDLEKDVSQKCIRFAEVQATFARHRGGAPADAEATVFVLDCCRDGMSCAVTGAGRGIGLQKAGAGAAARAEVKNAFVVFSTSSGRAAGDGRAGEGGPFMNVFTSELEKEGQQVTDVTMRTRRRMFDSSEKCQLAQDESTLTAHLYFNGHARKLPADVPPLTSADAEPVKRVSRVVFGVDLEDVGAFQARDAELGKLREWAEDGGGASKKRMLVHGMGGMGKTTIGKMFAARAAADGVKEAVLFLSLTDGSSVGVYSGLAEALGAKGDSDFQGMKEEELRALVHRLLGSDEWRGKWVVVLDDLPDPQEERARWIAEDFPFGSGKTLVTSRSPGWAEEGGVGKWEQLALQGMTGEQACAWVLRRVEAWVGDEHKRAPRSFGCSGRRGASAVESTPFRLQR
ncbi:hypothetical protein T484DRAFT_3190659 [Baffinella frigidus]|nr:hypothetical protein T484DRAFT_3190659 [Cryptophyta sp. CCMP2293]